ncbi:unnamed protein product [Meganyctiphanes norvegica]|uniref:Myb-like domain-containing protein n=1 Tax=Meganyctiphanes norvegica TaxID=48144 RepID=A0AAV2SEY6_MEGNR
MEEAVASILGERMKQMTAAGHSSNQQSTIFVVDSSQEHVDHPTIEHTSLANTSLEPIIEHTVDNTLDHTENVEERVIVDGVEIPSANVYMYDNPVYLNRLMKDNTFGRRVRHDAPYAHKLGPWDNKSSLLLIQLLAEFPKAYFILDKECKRTEAWEIIRARLAEAGYQFTVLQIRMRWREICKKYRNTINHNELNNTKRTCQYMEELNQLFGAWDQTATFLLIRQLEANGSKRLGQNGGTRMRHKVWEHIRQFLISNGYQYTANQVQGRWNSLVTLYQRMIEHNSKPHNEAITIAYKEHIERVYKYVPERNIKWLKLMEKRGRTPKKLLKRWTQPVERVLLAAYQARVYRFNNEHVNNNGLWQEIVQELETKMNYSCTIDKVRSRFYELTKQFSLVEQHNAQSGTIRRESRHHQILSQIYNVYSYWPHDRSTIKLNRSNAIRMRQVNAQLLWGTDESRAVLQLYPRVLVGHLSNGEHQPIDELWLQLAKAYLNTHQDRRQPYELEEHISLMRRGYHGQNPFPFSNEMQLLEETEQTLGFTPDPLYVDSSQLVPYWSHEAAILLLDLLIHRRQDGLKNTGVFEIISRDMTSYGYRYTGEECRVYYSLLRQIYMNRLRTIKQNKDLLKPFPYMDKMAEVDQVVATPRFVVSEENCRKLLVESVRQLEDWNITESSSSEAVVNAIHRFHLHIKRTEFIKPAPTLKAILNLYLESIKKVGSQSQGTEEAVRLYNLLGLHQCHLEALLYPVAQEKKVGKKKISQKTSNLQWSDSNLRILLSAVLDVRQVCHNNTEFDLALAPSQAIWKEAASRIAPQPQQQSLRPDKCYEKFAQLCREYKSCLTFNSRLKVTNQETVLKKVQCHDLLEILMSPIVCHDAAHDQRDEWWASGEGGAWSRDETLDLLFTVREIWSGEISVVDWNFISDMLNASNFQRSPNVCKERFYKLYTGFSQASQHNERNPIRTRRRPPFYFKMKAFFGQERLIPKFNSLQYIGPTDEINISQNLQEEVDIKILECLRQLRGHSCHSVPRIPLLLNISKQLQSSFLNGELLPVSRVWKVLVQLHQIHHESIQQGKESVYAALLENIWRDDLNPLIAFGMHALPTDNWEQVQIWSMEETKIILETIIGLRLESSDQVTSKTMYQESSAAIIGQGLFKTPEECCSIWQYMQKVFHHGGYHDFFDKINMLYLLQPELIENPHPPQPPEHHPLISEGHGSDVVLESKRVITSTVKQADGRKRKQQPDKYKQGVESQKWKSNKLKVEDEFPVTLKIISLSEEDIDNPSEIEDLEAIEKVAPGNVASYVCIKVPQQQTHDKSQNTNHKFDYKCNTKTSVILKTEPSSGILNTGITVKTEPSADILNSEFKTDTESLTDIINTERIKTLSELDNSVADCVHTGDTEQFKVEIVSISQNGSFKLVECRLPSEKNIILECPSSYEIPQGTKHIFIPKSMIDIDKLESRKLVNDDTPQISCTGENTPIIDQREVLREVEHYSDSKKEIAVCDTEKVDGKQKNNYKVLMEAINEYRNRCKIEKERLLTAMKVQHQEHVESLKGFIELMKDVDDNR